MLYRANWGLGGGGGFNELKVDYAICGSPLMCSCNVCTNFDKVKPPRVTLIVAFMFQCWSLFAF